MDSTKSHELLTPEQEQALIDANAAGEQYLEALKRQNEAGDKLMESMKQYIAELERVNQQEKYVWECNLAIEEESKRTA